MTWKGCKQGAESWSDDDGNSNCKAELETACFRGTYYYNGSGTQSWFAPYSAAGHEIASHTVGHPCTRTRAGRTARCRISRRCVRSPLSR